MVRISALAAIAVASALAVASSEKVGSGRQFAGGDVTGDYDLFVKQGSCAKSIAHGPLTTADDATGVYTLAHSAITQENKKCSGSGALKVVTKEAIVTAGVDFIFETPPLKKVVESLESQGATFLIGFEEQDRNCGSTMTAKNSIFVFVEEEKNINVPQLITLRPGAKYMIVYEPTSPTPCTYFSKAIDREIGTTAATPASTPAADDSPNGAQVAAGAAGAAGVAAGVAAGNATPDTTTGEDSDMAQASSEVEDDTGSAAIGGLPVSSTDGSDSITSSEEPEEAENSDVLGTTFGDQEPEFSSEEMDDGSACFPADGIVELENGSTKTMDKIELGDRVKVSSGGFSDVFMFTHKIADSINEFVTISTASGASLSVTKGHYLYVNGALTAAKTVKTGDVLELGNGASSTVESVSCTTARGLFNPQTVNGDIIVNGVRASTYTRTVEPSVAHSLLAPVRAAYNALGWTTSALDSGANMLAQVAPKGQAVF